MDRLIIIIVFISVIAIALGVMVKNLHLFIGGLVGILITIILLSIMDYIESRDLNNKRDE
jgi:uncharacterized membrane protein